MFKEDPASLGIWNILVTTLKVAKHLFFCIFLHAFTHILHWQQLSLPSDPLYMIICRVAETCWNINQLVRIVPQFMGVWTPPPKKKNNTKLLTVPPLPVRHHHATQVHIRQRQPCFQTWIITLTSLDRPSTQEVSGMLSGMLEKAEAKYSSQTWQGPKSWILGIYIYIYPLLSIWNP